MTGTSFKSNSPQIAIVLACSLLVFAPGAVGTGADWPTYRSDIRRSGVGKEAIGSELFLQWKYMDSHPPKPAWPMPAEEMPRMHSDNAYHVIVADGNVYFGSSITNKVYAMDAATGVMRWAFFTEGPVRFAPTIVSSRVYVGSDDGYVYCIDAKNGKLIWKYRAGPSGEKVIGNGRMISLWPVRTGVLVDDGIAYFGAGVFPYEGIYICALDASDGSAVWRNDTVGDRVHELRFGGISPHGYLVASKDTLYVPSGRAMPAAFSRKTGELLSYTDPGQHRGGSWALLDDDRLIAGVDFADKGVNTPYKSAYDAKNGTNKGEVFALFPGIDMVLTSEFAYLLCADGIWSVDRAAYRKITETYRPISPPQRVTNKQKELSGLLKTRAQADGKMREEISQQIDQANRRTIELTAEEKRLRRTSVRWHYSAIQPVSLILSRDILFAGGEGLVAGIDAQTGKEVWKSDVSGKATNLVVAGGRLFVSTDKGLIYCFGKEKVLQPNHIKTPFTPNPYSENKLAKTYALAAREIVDQTCVTKGYCLVVDCGQGELAFELAKRTQLQIVGIEKDLKKLAIARKNLEAAGLLGDRVVVEPWDISALPDYFANLITSDDMLVSGTTGASKDEIKRVLQPYGGVAYLGTGRGGTVSWHKLVRGEPEGAGAWTQLYANPENTGCSADARVKGPLGVLWFGEPGPQGMIERHGRATCPLSANGRLFIQGEEVITAYDAYNGSFLWERKIPGAIRVRVDVDGGNLALTEDALYVAAFDKCYRLDPATGETVCTYEVPSADDGSKRRWGYIACIGNTLFGTASVPLREEYAARYKAEYAATGETLGRSLHRDGQLWAGMANFPVWTSQRSPKNALTNRLMCVCGDAIFALDIDSGNPRWIHHGQGIPNISVTIADGAVFFVESAPTSDEQAAALKKKQQLVNEGIYKEHAEASLKPGDADIRVVVALNATTGQILWKKPLYLTGCGGDKMGTACADGLLLFFGHFSNHDSAYALRSELCWRRITAVSAKTGEVVWSRPLNYRRRPLIVGDRIIIEPRACDLYTGEIITRSHPITGEQVPWEFFRPGRSCGVVSASAHTLFYRSNSIAIYELTEDRGLSVFGAVRPGCWLNMICANGLMLMSEASCGCTCSYPLRCSLALAHKPEKTNRWTATFVSPGTAMTPVKHLAVNLGAPGDMKDGQGTLWFGYPRPRITGYTLKGYVDHAAKFNLNEKFASGMGYFCRDYKGVNIENADKPWLFTSGCLGLLGCKLPLVNNADGQKPGIYTVRLGFKSLPDDRLGQRVFDIKLQNRVVLKDFDILQAAGTANKAVVREFNGVRVENNLILELVPKSTRPKIDNAPIMNFIEVVRTDGYDSLSAYASYRPARIDVMASTEFISPEATGPISQLRVHVRLLDAFDHQIKSPGVFRFELYQYVEHTAIVKGRKILDWPDIDLTSALENSMYWRDFLRAYEFDLDFALKTDQSYVLQASFSGADGKHLTVNSALRYPR